MCSQHSKRKMRDMLTSCLMCQRKVLKRLNFFRSVKNGHSKALGKVLNIRPPLRHLEPCLF